MQLLVNTVQTAAGLHTPPWVKNGRGWNDPRANIPALLAQAEGARRLREGDATATREPFLPFLGSEQDDFAITVTLHRIVRSGRLVHVSQNREAALREIVWRGWAEGEDGVVIEEQDCVGETMHGVTDRPHRYGSPWPPAKEEEFAKLFLSGTSIRDLEVHFDAAASMLDRKRRKLGLPKRQ